MARKVKTITFDSKADADVLAYLNAQDNQSQTVRDALRAYMAMQEEESKRTIDDVYEALQELSSQIVSSRIVVTRQDEDAPGTEEAADALDSLGL